MEVSVIECSVPRFMGIGELLPRADSPISYKFRFIWLCVWVFLLRIYYFPSSSRFVWTGENDSNTLRVDQYFFWQTEKKTFSVFKNIWMRVVVMLLFLVA